MADSRPGERRLTTAEAAARLGVKPETVYAYVSRGLLSSTRGTGGRGSTFDATEVATLAARHQAGRSPAGVVESVTTGLTLLADDEISYRGHLVRDLVGRHDLAQVAGLLWLNDLGADVRWAVPESVPALRPVVEALPTGARLTDRLRVAVAALASADPWRFDLSLEAVVRTGGALVPGLVELVSPASSAPESPTSVSPVPESWSPEGASLADRLWPLLSDAPAHPEVLDTALVVLADHGLAASTLTARVAASARAHVYAVVSAGLGALDGPVHGTASTASYRFLGEALVDPRRAVAERLRAGERIPGFGHTIYRTRDPRTELLLATIAGSDAASVVGEVADALGERSFPNVDLALAAVMHAHRMRPDAGEAIFAIARTVGWIAHALEEYAERGLRFRVEGSYVGPHPPSNRPRSIDPSSDPSSDPSRDASTGRSNRPSRPR